MFKFEEIINMSKEDFVKNWNNNKIQDSSLKLLGAREMTEEEKQSIQNK